MVALKETEKYEKKKTIKNETKREIIQFTNGKHI